MNVAYLVLKTAHSLFGKNPGALDQEELRKVERLAARQFDLEARVLASTEARDVVVPGATLEAALEEVRSRYPDLDTFRDDLAGNGLSIEVYEQSLVRELRVQAVLDKVGSRAAKVSDIDVELYYHYHPEQFHRPELRRARHILVTVNETLPDNTADLARARIDAIAQRLAKDPKRFEEQALKHSECPTAMQGGLLGDAKPGQLFPALDAALFAMAPMEISPVLESPLGFHLLRCDEILPARVLHLPEVKEQIRERLYESRKKVCLNAWLKRAREAA
ncbi:MAG: nitrogen fixation protein NifM [Pseudomonadota bacterium]